MQKEKEEEIVTEQTADGCETKDPRLIKVKGTTNPEGLARSILHVLKDHDYAKVNSVGPKALSVTMFAYRLARGRIQEIESGAVLVCAQSEYVARVDDKPTRGLSTRMFCIPIKYAL